MVPNLAAFSAVLLLCQHVAESSAEKPCEFPKGMCLCYSELESSLIATDQNRISLSTAFFPLEDNPPEFVTVHYTFKDTNEEQVWFWSAVTSHFLHPFEVFQFSSLFFGKPEPYYRGSLIITLQAECANLSSTDIKLQLLTQRLKVYAERGTTNPILLDDYSAHAYSEESLKELFERNSHRTTNIIIWTFIIVVVLCFLIVVLTSIMFAGTKSYKKSKLIEKLKNNPSAVLSLAVLSFIANIYIICLAGTALGYWMHRGEDVLRNLFHTGNCDEKRNLVPLVFALVIDVICLFLWSFLAVVVTRKYVYVCYKNCQQGCCKNKCARDPKRETKDTSSRSKISSDDVAILSLTVLCPIFCIIAHSPYIAIAYLDDGYHASSIFIYYSLIGYILFGIMWLIFHSFENLEEDNCKITDLECPIIICCTWACLISVIFILLGLIVTITCYFVLIPINKSISDAPNRVFSIYQSGGFVIGSFIVYKVLKFFYRNKAKDKTECAYALLQVRVPLQQQLPQMPQAPATDGSDHEENNQQLQQQNSQMIELQVEVPPQQKPPQTIARIDPLLQVKVPLLEQTPQTIERTYTLLQESARLLQTQKCPARDGGQENDQQKIVQESEC